jgi:hypothetical protein
MKKLKALRRLYKRKRNHKVLEVLDMIENPTDTLMRFNPQPRTASGGCSCDICCNAKKDNYGGLF